MTNGAAGVGHSGAIFFRRLGISFSKVVVSVSCAGCIARGRWYRGPMKRTRGRAIVGMMAVSLVGACGDSATVDSVCKKLVKLDDSDRKMSPKECAKQIGILKASMDDTDFQKLGMCVNKASDKESAFECLLVNRDLNSYVNKSKAVEAKIMLRKIGDGARAFSYEEHVDPGGLGVLPAGLPGPSMGPTPPLGQCCKEGGKCTANPSYWQDPTWQALMFEIMDPHYYSYEYRLAEDKKSFEIRAYGDLDCDQEYSTYSMRGVMGEDGVEELEQVPPIRPME